MVNYLQGLIGDFRFRLFSLYSQRKDGDVIVAAGNAKEKGVVSWIRTFTQI